jgi:hypothetical protein
MAPAQRVDAEPEAKAFRPQIARRARMRGPKKTMVYRGMTNISLSHLPDDALLAEARRVVAHERQATAQVIALLMELDARRLYLGEGYSSLFVYCTQVLHLSEHATYGRIEAARAARRFPVMLDLLADGSITLTR